jgi:hypothetical protein
VLSPLAKFTEKCVRKCWKHPICVEFSWGCRAEASQLQASLTRPSTSRSERQHAPGVRCCWSGLDSTQRSTAWVVSGDLVRDQVGIWLRVRVRRERQRTQPTPGIGWQLAMRGQAQRSQRSQPPILIAPPAYRSDRKLRRAMGMGFQRLFLFSHAAATATAVLIPGLSFLSYVSQLGIFVRTVLLLGLHEFNASACFIFGAVLLNCKCSAFYLRISLTIMLFLNLSY